MAVGDKLEVGNYKIWEVWGRAGGGERRGGAASVVRALDLIQQRAETRSPENDVSVLLERYAP